MYALTRAISDSIAHCELTHLARTPLDVDQARREHHAYVTTLRELGCTILALEKDENHPDGVFVEDCAIVLPEVAIITRPGAASRRGERPPIRDLLSTHREVVTIEAPGTIDGGDVLRIGRHIYVGASGRSNAQGADQLAKLVAPHGYVVERVPMTDCLHLKSACTLIQDDTLLANPAWVDTGLLSIEHVIPVHEQEPFAANALRIGEAILMGTQFPKTIQRVEDHGFTVIPVANTELAKAEGGLTCCSVIWA